MDAEDWGEEPVRETGPLLPPDDRPWRHPSELGPWGAVVDLAPVAALHHPGRRAAVAAGFAGVMAATALLVLTAGMRMGSSTTATGSGLFVPAGTRMASQLLVASTTVVVPPTTPVAWLGISTDDNKTVSEVATASPAAAAGIRRGDQIVAVDGKDVSSVTAVVREIREHHPGESCPLEVLRSGRRFTLTVVLGRLQ